MAHDFQVEIVQTSERGQVRAREGSVRRVEVYPGGQRENSHHRRTSTPYPTSDAPHALYTLICEEPDILTIADDLSDRGIGLRVLVGTLAGTYSPTWEGKFFFKMMAAFAELERDLIRERTMAGLATARAQGRTGGRPRVMDGDMLAVAHSRRANGESPARLPRPSKFPAPLSAAT